MKINGTEGKRPTVSLCMMLRDEGKTVERVIRSFGDLPDEIVVGIDSKTEDDTEGICRRFTDRIHRFEFHNNFAEIRNRLMDLCRMDWIVMPDGHEVLKEQSLEPLRKALAAVHREGDADVLQPYICFGERENHGIPRILFPRPIVIRNGIGIRWRSSFGTHNYLNHDPNRSPSLPEVRLSHEMDPERGKWRDRQRFEMNRENLSRAIRENPDDLRAVFYLGTTFADNRNFDEAREQFEILLEKIDRIRGNPDMAAQACVYLARIHSIRRETDLSRSACLRGIGYRWDRREFYFYLGVASQDEEKYPEAVFWYEVAAKLPVPVSAYFLEGDVYSWLPYDGIMVCRSRLGDFEGALSAARQVYGFHPSGLMEKNIESLLHNIRKMETLRGVSDDAVDEGQIGSFHPGGNRLPDREKAGAAWA